MDVKSTTSDEFDKVIDSVEDLGNKYSSSLNLLENELDNNVDKFKIVSDELRSDHWQTCLEIKNKVIKLSEIYDLPEQSLIREECQNFMKKNKININEFLCLQSDLETIITNFSKNHNIKYHEDNGWLDILKIILPLNVSREETYNIFEAILLKYVPKCGDHNEDENKTVLNQQPFYLLRLLLLYHDAELCSLLDTKKISPDMYTLSWLKSLFAKHSKIKVIQLIWDVYFKQKEPMMIFFLSLILLINAKEDLFEMKDEPREKIVEFLNSRPNKFEIEDIIDVYELIELFYLSHTPESIKDLHDLVFWNNLSNEIEDSELKKEEKDDNITDLAQLLCLPVPVKSIIPSTIARSKFRFFIVDCRPAEQYNNGHITTAFHLDCSLMLQEPNAFNTAIQALIASQQQAIEVGSLAGGKHLCFLGSGREEEDRYLNMVVASFLQKKHVYVSVAYGGYEKLHDYLVKNQILDINMFDHNRRYCLTCVKHDRIRSISSNSASNPKENFTNKMTNSSSFLNFYDSISSTFATINKNINKNQEVKTLENDKDELNESLFEKMAVTLKSKSQVVKEKLVDILASSISPNDLDKHVSSHDLGKRYKPNNLDVSDDECLNESDKDNNLEIDLVTWCKQNNSIGQFKCKELGKNNVFYPSYLVLTADYLYIMRAIPHNKGYAKIVAKRSYENLLQITSKRRSPEIITIKYGHHSNNGEENQIKFFDQLIIPNQKEVLSLIKQQIVLVTKESS